MGKTSINDRTMVQDSNGSVKEVVATDPYAIGYISLGIVDDKVKAVSINKVAATITAIKDRKYRIVRPFIYVTFGEPNHTARVFIDFVLSREGQNILRKEGLIPANG
jgi:phosphate transport system substrate-binding protein